MTQPLAIELAAREDTERLGFELASIISNRALILLNGPLGAGKTTFAKGVARALGVSEVVSSPTFTMLNEYFSGRLPLYHLDLYRLKEDAGTPAMEGSLLESELEELSESDGLILVEWPDVMMDYFSHRDFLCVELNYSDVPTDNNSRTREEGETGRTAHIQAHGMSAGEIVGKLANVYFS